MKELLTKLKKDIPEFWEYEEFDNLVYVDFDRLGTFINLLAAIKYGNYKNDFSSHSLLHKVFKYLNEIYDKNNPELLNLFKVTIFESILETRYCYDVAKDYMSKEMHDHFLKVYPYEVNKDAWDTRNYYTDEEYQRILNLPDVHDENKG